MIVGRSNFRQQITQARGREKAIEGALVRGKPLTYRSKVRLDWGGGNRNDMEDSIFFQWLQKIIHQPPVL